MKSENISSYYLYKKQCINSSITDKLFATQEYYLNIKNQYYEVTFEPQSGLIPAKSDIDISMTLVPLHGGPFYHLFECDVEGIAYPLGFEFQT